MSPVKVAFKTRDVYTKEPNLLLKRINRLNPELKSEEWRVLHKVVEPHSIRWIFEVDWEAADAIRRADFGAYTGLDKGIFKIISDPNTKVKEKECLTETQTTSSQGEESDDTVLNINSLPEEILVKIFGYLSQNKLGQIAPVCKRWNVLRMSPSLWKKVDVELHASVFWDFDSFPEPVGWDVAGRFISTLPPCVTHMRLDFTVDPDFIDPMDFEVLCMNLQEKCPRLKVFILCNTKLLHSILDVIDLCSIYLENIKGLSLDCCEFPYIVGSEKCDCVSKIEVLDLFGCRRLGNLGKQPFSMMPFLKELRLASTEADDSWFENQISFLNQLHVLDLGETKVSFQTFLAIQDHGSNLKELYVCHTDDLEDSDLNFDYPVFPQLKTICLRSCQGVTCEGVVSLVQSCQSLENVYVDEDVAVLYAAHPFIVVNKCKLGIVKVIRHCADHRKSNYLYE